MAMVNAIMAVVHIDPPFIIAILLALSVHECAHAYVANILGDPTAKYDGRITLNPIAHIDPLGAVFFLIAGFGWGKPVPVNPRYLGHPRRDEALVALAGPLSNFLLALVAALPLRYLALINAISDTPLIGSGFTGFILQILVALVSVNLGLMAFNLLPIAPLDGSKILHAIIPLQFEDAYEQYLQYGTYLLIALLLADRIVGFSPLGWWIDVITTPIVRFIGMS